MLRIARVFGPVIVILAIVFTIARVDSRAPFSDTTQSTGSSFTAGSVVLDASPSSAAVSFSDMLPGDEIAAPISVTNNGTAQLRYVLTSTTTENTLAAQLDFTVKVGVTNCDTTNWQADGSVLYSAGILGSTGTQAVFGDATAGADSGDRVLDASATEALCLHVLLPLSTDSSFEGTSTTATLTFIAEQTANNA